MEAEKSTSLKTKPNGHDVSCSGKSHNCPELKIVLIGGREIGGIASYKSVTGNIILGKRVFETKRRTSQSVVRQHEVHGRHVTVVDTPGWWWHYPQQNTPELDKMEIENSVHLCPPGPHAFLLVIPVGLEFSQIYKASLEEHLQLFHKGVLNHTMVLFSVDATFNDTTLENEIRMWPALQWIVEQCGNRTHILNISNSWNSAQVVVLFNKIEAMVAENGGNHYSVDSAVGDSLREKMQAIVERASKRFADVQKQRRKLKALIEGGKTPPAHLRLVMVGAQWSAKSSAGNTILRKNAFSVEHKRTTVYCEMSHSIVADRQLTVVDSPGWFYNHTLQDTSEMDKLEIESSVYMCLPGPHAVLLVVGLTSAFNTSYQRAVQEHMSLFSDEVWMHTIVLFTRGYWLGLKTVEERIESEEGLQWLVEKCGNRYHVLDNMNHSDEKQVTELIEKIEEMWAGNKEPHYEVSLGPVEQMEAKKEAGHKMAKIIRRTSQRQSRVLRELFRGEMQSLTDMRVVLVGQKESGKSMAGNRILFEELFDAAWMKKEFQHQRESVMSVKHQQRNIGGVDISVVETPGCFTDTMTPDWLRGEVLHSITLCAPGPHVFLLVIPISKAFTVKDHKAVVDLLTPFSERVWRHCMVLFTWGDWLSDRTIEEHIAREGKALQRLVEKCGNRYHVLNCSRFRDVIPVIELFQKIFDMVTRNKGHYFTTEDKLRKQQTPVLSRQARQAMLSEEEWNRREQELIDRMLKAVAQEPEEPTPPPVRMAASIDDAFIPTMSEGAPSEVGSTFWSQKARAKVSEWLSIRVGNSEGTSGVGSASASYVERLDVSPLPDDSHQPMKRFFPEKDKKILDIVKHPGVSTDIVGTIRRYSC